MSAVPDNQNHHREVTEKELERLSKEQLKRIASVRSSLILSSPFFGALALRLKPKAVILFTAPGMKVRFMTCATDGQYLYYNPLWTAGISDSELKGVYCHEVLHCALAHMFRRGERDPTKWNIACDGAVNRTVLQMGLKLPSEGVDKSSFVDSLTDEQYTLFNAEQLYPHVKPGPIGEGEYAWGTVLDAPVTDQNGDSRADQEAKWKVATVQAAQAAKMQGRLPAGLEKLVGEITRNRVDWRSYLRKFVQASMQNDYNWRRPAARYMYGGLYLPSLHSEKVPPIVVVGDTSGSCWGEQEKFFGELRSILEEVQPEAIHFMQVDAAVEDYRVLLPGDDIGLTVHGGGGTSFKPPFEKVKELEIEPACLIYFTDMYGDFPDEAPEYPVLWAATTRDTEGPFGETLYLGDD